MRVKLHSIIYLFLFLMSVLFTGCAKSNQNPIVTINDTKLYKQDFAYEIWLVETEGNQLEKYYQKNLKCSYWDYTYQGTTMRRLAKNSIIASVVMHEILFDQAKDQGIKLTKQELLENQRKLKNIYEKYSKKELNRALLTKDVLSNSIHKIALADKYKKQLCEHIFVDKNAIIKTIDRNDYSYESQYQKAIKEAINSEIDKQFEPIYQSMKAKYKISIDFDTWDSITIGTTN